MDMAAKWRPHPARAQAVTGVELSPLAGDLRVGAHWRPAAASPLRARIGLGRAGLGLALGGAQAGLHAHASTASPGPSCSGEMSPARSEQAMQSRWH